jgi:hypothetical protein
VYSYNITFENLKAGRLVVTPVSMYEEVFGNIMEVVKAELEKLPPGASDLKKINAQNRAFVSQGVVHDSSSGLARFDHVLFEGAGGNCTAMSQLSLAVEEKAVGSDCYQFYSWTEHTQTVLVTPSGKRFAFDNNELKDNQGKRVRNNKGLALPREVFVMQYLVNQGYELTQFPEELQKFWDMREGSAQGGGKGDDPLFSRLPDRGYCYEGDDDCFVDDEEGGLEIVSGRPTEGPHAQKIKYTWKPLEQRSLSEILHSTDSYWSIRGNESLPPPSDQESLSLSIIKFRSSAWQMREMRDAMRRHLHGGRGQLQSLSKWQLFKLREFVLFGPNVFDDENERLKFIAEVLDKTVDSHTPEQEIARIFATAPSEERQSLLVDYVTTYGQLPDELVPILSEELRQNDHYAYRAVSVLGKIKNISVPMLRVLLESLYAFHEAHGYKKVLYLGITDITPPLADEINRFDWEEVHLGNLVIRDAASARALVFGLHAKELFIKDVADASAAQEIARAKSSLIVMYSGKLLTPQSAAALAQYKGSLSLDMEVLMRESSQETRDALLGFTGDSLHVSFSYGGFSMEAIHYLAQFKVGVLNLKVSMNNGMSADMARAFVASKARNIKVDFYIIGDDSDVYGDRLEFDDETVKILGTAFPRVHFPASIDSKMRIARYRTPAPEKTAEVESRGDSNAVQAYLDDYQRLTPAMAARAVRGNRSSSTAYSREEARNDYTFVQFDAQVARALLEEYNSPNFYRYENIDLKFYELTADAAREFFKFPPEVDSVDVEIVSPVSPEALRAILKNCEQRKLHFEFQFPLTRELVDVFVEYRYRLRLTVPEFNEHVYDLVRRFQGEDGVALKFSKPLSSADATIHSQIQALRNLGDATARPFYFGFVSPEAYLYDDEAKIKYENAAEKEFQRKLREENERAQRRGR